MVRCRFCGGRNYDDANFCEWCGRALNEDTAIETVHQSSPGSVNEQKIPLSISVRQPQTEQEEQIPTTPPQEQREEEADTAVRLVLPPSPLGERGQAAGESASMVQGARQVERAPGVQRSPMMQPQGLGRALAPADRHKVAILLVAAALVAASVVWLVFGPNAPSRQSSASLATQKAVTVRRNSTSTDGVKTHGGTYAFVRKKQLWMVTNNEQPVQLTNFSYVLPNEQGVTDTTVYWSQPSWSPDRHYLAFIMANLGTGLGGGGCPGPTYAYGGLYLVDLVSKQITQVREAGASPVQADAKITGLGQTIQWGNFSWEDATHLLLLPAYDQRGPDEGKTGLYRYDVKAQKLGQVIHINAASLLGAEQVNTPFVLLSLRYSQGQIYYEVVTHPFEATGQVAIYSRSVMDSSSVVKRVAQLGTIGWCSQSTFIYPGWDISPDGRYLAVQAVLEQGGQATSTVQVIDVKTGAKTEAFGQMAGLARDKDMGLEWSPNSKALLLIAQGSMHQLHFYVTTLDRPEVVKKHSHTQSVDAPCNRATWQPDGEQIALECGYGSFTPHVPSVVYTFTPGDAQEHQLLSDASSFNWN